MKTLILSAIILFVATVNGAPRGVDPSGDGKMLLAAIFPQWCIILFQDENITITISYYLFQFYDQWLAYPM